MSVIAFQQQAKDLTDILFDFNNPIYYSLIAIVFVIIIVYFFFYYVIFPLNKKYLLEKKDLELKQMKLMALFADLDPDPVLRISDTGEIIYTNNAAKSTPVFSALEGKNIHDFLTSGDYKIDEIIKDNLNYSYTARIRNKYYIISFRGASYVNIAQIYFHDITNMKHFENKLKLSRKKLKSLSNYLIELREDERQRIARELHDGVGQNLLFLKLKVQNMEGAIRDSFSPEEYESLAGLFEGTIRDLRSVIYDLKPKILDEMGLGSALTYLCESASRESNIEGKIDIIGHEKRLNYKYELTIYRVIQECINNIIKHSKANTFNIQFIQNNDKIRVIISDDGIGFEEDAKAKKGTPSKAGFGLLNIRERISSLKGVFKIDSNSNGTIIFIEIPISPSGKS